MAEFPVATSPAPGVMGVDWDDSVDFERSRRYRLGRVRAMLEEHDLGAVLLFETSNIRYATATQIGYWAFNKWETYAPAADGHPAARIEEELVVTGNGCKVITLFPCEELVVANAD